jgi:hypothetical protein
VKDSIFVSDVEVATQTALFKIERAVIVERYCGAGASKITSD